MKTKTLLFGLMLVALPALVMPVNVAAYDFMKDDIYYDIIGPSQVAVVSADSIVGYELVPTYSGHIVIPSTVDHDGMNYTVTTIGDGAFFKCRHLNSVTLPSTITELHWEAFMESTARLIVPDLEMWCNINFHIDSSYGQGDPDFRVWPHELDMDPSIENLVIPSSVTAVHDYSFYNTETIRSVVIPDQVTVIGQGAFAVCEKLKSVKIGANVTYIGYRAFDTNFFSWYSDTYGVIDEVTCMATVPPELYNSYGLSSFNKGTFKNGVLYVPAQSVEAYRADANWGQFENIRPIPAVQVQGDVNGDGVLSVADVTALIDLLLNAN